MVSSIANTWKARSVEFGAFNDLFVVKIETNHKCLRLAGKHPELSMEACRRYLNELIPIKETGRALVEAIGPVQQGPSD